MASAFQAAFAALAMIANPAVQDRPTAAPVPDPIEVSDAVCRADDAPLECGPGVWLGPLEICAAGSVTTDFAFDEWGLPVLNLAFDDRLRVTVAKVTYDHVGRVLPLRLDGRTLTAPYVREAIPGGHVQISGLDMAEAQRLQAALKPCAPAADQNSRVSR